MSSRTSRQFTAEIPSTSPESSHRQDRLRVGRLLHTASRAADEWVSPGANEPKHHRDQRKQRVDRKMDADYRDAIENGTYVPLLPQDETIARKFYDRLAHEDGPDHDDYALQLSTERQAERKAMHEPTSGSPAPISPYDWLTEGDTDLLRSYLMDVTARRIGKGILLRHIELGTYPSNKESEIIQRYKQLLSGDLTADDEALRIANNKTVATATASESTPGPVLAPVVSISVARKYRQS